MKKKEEPRGGRITALESQVHRPGRFSLFLDERFVCGVSQEIVWDHGLTVGKEISAEEERALLGDTETQRARDIAYLLLSYRARSSAEIEAKLSQKGFAPELVKKITDELKSSGLLDDGAFAESWVRYRRQTKPRGKALLRWELRRKGISREQTETALQSLTPEDEVETARSIALARWEREKNSDPAALKKRIVGLLQRRGYNWETIQEALSALDAFDRGDKLWDESSEES